MTKINMHIFSVKLPFYPLCEVKCGLQNGVSTGVHGRVFIHGFFFFLGQCTISCQDQYHNLMPYIIRHYFKILALFTIALTSTCMLKGHPDYLSVVDVE